MKKFKLRIFIQIWKNDHAPRAYLNFPYTDAKILDLYHLSFLEYRKTALFLTKKTKMQKRLILSSYRKT